MSRRTERVETLIHQEISKLVGAALRDPRLRPLVTVARVAVSPGRPAGGRGGRLAGFAYSAAILGFFVGPTIGGWLANSVGAGGVFYVAAAVASTCVLGVAVLVGTIGFLGTSPVVASALSLVLAVLLGGWAAIHRWRDWRQGRLAA